ncbi:MAG: AAA family ATPase [Simkania sp.]|nr:AAA family ATPase [Simkania sp.]
MEEFQTLSCIDRTFADRVLYHTGREKDENLRELLISVMAAAREGHLCIGESALSPNGRAGFNTLKASSDVFASFLHIEAGRIYLEKNWSMEQSIVEDLRRLTGEKKAMAYLSNSHLNIEQNYAVETALSHRLTLLTGGPGTGKTYTAAAIVKAWISQGNKGVFLAAPTGRAADHLSKQIEAICGQQYPYGTLHRILGIGSMPAWPKEQETIDANLLLIDECSMIDAPMFATLLKAISNECTTVLMGDPNQLSPVGIGSVFTDLINSTRYSLAKAHLTRSVRTENKEILDLAQTVLRREVASHTLISWPTAERELFSLLKQFMEPWTCSYAACPPRVEELFVLLPKFRLLNSLRQGPHGMEAINQWFFNEIQKNTPEGFWWWAPLMITRNDEGTGLNNGELGVYLEKKGDRSSGAAYFRGRAEPIPEISLPAWEYAFCSSVHKSQGSEYDEVFVMFPKGSERFGREMVYTAITRAKKKVYLLADSKVIETMLSKSFKKQSGIDFVG